MPDDIKLPEPFILVADQPWGGHAEVIASARGTEGVIEVYTADQVRAAVLADREGRQQPFPAEDVLVAARMWKSDARIRQNNWRSTDDTLRQAEKEELRADALIAIAKAALEKPHEQLRGDADV